MLRLGIQFIHFPGFHEPESIPYLVAEIPALFGKALIEKEIIACGRTKKHSNPYAVGTNIFS